MEPDFSVDPTGTLYQFDQTRFNGGDHMDESGFVYFPESCQNGKPYVMSTVRVNSSHHISTRIYLGGRKITTK